MGLRICTALCRRSSDSGMNGEGKGEKFIRRNGEPAGTRTQDPRLKRALLYQLSYGLSRCLVFSNEALVSPAFSGPCILFRVREMSSNTDFSLIPPLFNFTRSFELTQAFHGRPGFVLSAKRKIHHKKETAGRVTPPAD
jgi:hypothetical protein